LRYESASIAKTSLVQTPIQPNEKNVEKVTIFPSSELYVPSRESSENRSGGRDSVRGQIARFADDTSLIELEETKLEQQKAKNEELRLRLQLRQSKQQMMMMQMMKSKRSNKKRKRKEVSSSSSSDSSGSESSDEPNQS
jgi:hypothetical protein